ncbi:MAG: undecaprenyl-diphosphate phosphatase [Wenzhouxiangellaceae bacterium]|nr:undecaprenyl-diphosphate phosphatase [Wenzhouxiangellaceae bacterium]
MTLLQIIVLALVQGVSDYLPVSSSAHLVLVHFFTGWSDQGLAFDAAVHIGTLAAVCMYFRGELARLAHAAFDPDDRAGRTLLAGLALATVPALAVGALLADWIGIWARNPLLIAFTTITFALVLALADRYGTRRLEIDRVSTGSALVVGLAQVLALVPGTSRSGITITAGLALGLTRQAAARYSFLLSIPITAAAGAWGFISGLERGGSFELGQFALGALVSGAFAWATIALFMAWLKRFGMTPFVVYRLLLGAFLLYWFWPGSPAT